MWFKPIRYIKSGDIDHGTNCYTYDWILTLCLSTILISVRSHMCEHPSYNEIQREKKDKKEISDSCDIATQFHILKHFVGDVLEK